MCENFYKPLILLIAFAFTVFPLGVAINEALAKRYTGFLYILLGTALIIFAASNPDTFHINRFSRISRNFDWYDYFTRSVFIAGIGAQLRGFALAESKISKYYIVVTGGVFFIASVVSYIVITIC